MAILHLAWASLWNRRVTAALTALAIAISVAMLLGVEKLRRDARGSFANTISGTDLIVGARSGSVQLLLYSIFRIGNATNNISWSSYEAIAELPGVRWTVPLSLGDSHRGFRVLGTNQAYFEHYRYGQRRQLAFSNGMPFTSAFDAVLGAEVAERLGLEVDDPIVIAHGTGEISFADHGDKPFRVRGILARTGTPVDRTVHVSLEGIEAIHVGWSAAGHTASAQDAHHLEPHPEAITAFLVGLDSKMALFKLLRAINEYRHEPLLAIIPGVALQELWGIMGAAEGALWVVSVTVVVSGLLGMLTVILSSLEARRREMAVLRSVGARPLHIAFLFVSEAALLTLVGATMGVIALYAAVLALRPLATSALGLDLALTPLTASDWALLGVVLLAAVAVSAIPAIRAYKLSLADGLTLRI